MNTHHTPGPWTCGYGNYVYQDNGAPKDGQSLIATCMPLNGTGQELQIAFANARLIAAAPDLLAALEGMLHLNQTQGVKPEEYEAACDAANAAISKAKGETP